MLAFHLRANRPSYTLEAFPRANLNPSLHSHYHQWYSGSAVCVCPDELARQQLRAFQKRSRLRYCQAPVYFIYLLPRTNAFTLLLYCAHAMKPSLTTHIVCGLSVTDHSVALDSGRVTISRKNKYNVRSDSRVKQATVRIRVHISLSISVLMSPSIQVHTNSSANTIPKVRKVPKIQCGTLCVHTS